MRLNLRSIEDAREREKRLTTIKEIKNFNTDASRSKRKSVKRNESQLLLKSTMSNRQVKVFSTKEIKKVYNNATLVSRDNIDSKKS